MTKSWWCTFLTHGVHIVVCGGPVACTAPPLLRVMQGPKRGTGIQRQVNRDVIRYVIDFYSCYSVILKLSPSAVVDLLGSKRKCVVRHEQNLTVKTYA